MNTLNYKVLLVKTVFRLFIRAIGIYLLITIPAIAANPFMYLISATYAVSFGWIAAALFLLFFYIVFKMKYDAFVKNIFLYGSVALAVAVAFQMMEILGVEDHIWHSGAFLLFPAVAVVSGWISLAIAKRTINALFEPPETDLYDSMINNSSASENTI